MNLVALILTILFTLIGINNTGAVVKRSEANLFQSPIANAKAKDEHQSIKARKGADPVTNSTDERNDSLSTSLEKSNISSTAETHTRGDNLPTDKLKPENVHQNVDRASSSLPKGKSPIQQKESPEPSGSASSSIKTEETDHSAAGSSDNSKDSKLTKTDTSSSAHNQSNSAKSTSKISASTESKSSIKSTESKSSSKSTESKSSSKSSSINKKPSITYSVEDNPTLLDTIPRVRQYISPLTPIDTKFEADNAAYLQPSSDFVLDRSQSKREMYIFPLVVLIFLVPMILGVGIIVVRRVRDYWSTRHYRRMDFLVDGMYNYST